LVFRLWRYQIDLGATLINYVMTLILLGLTLAGLVGIFGIWNRLHRGEKE
jgi:hypothetical protein